MNKQEKEELANQLNSRLSNCPSGSWDKGYNEGLMNAVIVVRNMHTVDEPQKVRAKLAKHWHEDVGDCLWWNFQVEEPPYCGTPLDEDFPKYKTHFTELCIPDEVEEEPQWTIKIGSEHLTGLQFIKNGKKSDVQFFTNGQKKMYFSDESKAEAVALLVDGSVEEVAE